MDVTEKQVIFLINSLAGGGAEGVCINIANGLAEEGWKVDLVVLHLNNAAYLDRISDRVSLVVLDVNHARYALFPLCKYLAKAKPKKVLVFNHELAVLLVIIRFLYIFKFKLIARNINTLSKKRMLATGFWHKQVVTYLIDFLYCRVDHVINQCQDMEEDLLSIYPNLAGKTSVIYNPVNQNVEDAVKSIDYSKVVKEGYLLCVGRLEPQKAFHYVIEAFAKLIETHPGLRLKIVGQGDLEHDLKRLAKDLGLADKVDFEGFQKDMIPYYLKARATVLTSLYEGFPNVLIESITLGTPVVAFDCPSGPREIIEEGVNGYLIKNKSVTDLALMLKEVSQLSVSDIVNSSKPFSRTNAILQYAKVLSLQF